MHRSAFFFKQVHLRARFSWRSRAAQTAIALGLAILSYLYVSMLDHTETELEHKLAVVRKFRSMQQRQLEAVAAMQQASSGDGAVHAQAVERAHRVFSATGTHRAIALLDARLADDNPHSALATRLFLQTIPDAMDALVALQGALAAGTLSEHGTATRHRHLIMGKMAARRALERTQNEAAQAMRLDDELMLLLVPVQTTARQLLATLRTFPADSDVTWVQLSGMIAWGGEHTLLYHLGSIADEGTARLETMLSQEMALIKARLAGAAALCLLALLLLASLLATASRAVLSPAMAAVGAVAPDTAGKKPHD